MGEQNLKTEGTMTTLENEIRKSEGTATAKGNLARLIDVKSIVTLSLTFLFIFLAGKEVIDAKDVLTIYTTVIAFYFGTKYQQNAQTINENSTPKE